MLYGYAFRKQDISAGNFILKRSFIDMEYVWDAELLKPGKSLGLLRLAGQPNKVSNEHAKPIIRTQTTGTDHRLVFSALQSRPV